MRLGKTEMNLMELEKKLLQDRSAQLIGRREFQRQSNPL